MVWPILQAFLLGFLIDLFYVGWMWATRNNHYIIGIVASVSIAACSLFGFINVYDNRILAIPYLLGLAFGTFIGIYLQKRMKR